jgi:nitroimidazol reductase NimA-like FMN-containing flavoprotein (pyridoxamine 5'-phosphate oxidase superfamily)
MSEFREMRRKRQQLSEEESIGILQKATAGTLALLGDDDYPYAVPISYAYNDGKLYFHSALSGHKVDAIRKCNKASFCVIDDGSGTEGWWLQFKSVIVFGVIEMIDDPVVVEDISRRLSAKFVDDKEYVDHEIELSLKGTLLLKMRIEHMTGKKVNER